MSSEQLGNEVVFPAAGYFAMAIEAITQMNTDSVVPAEIYSFTLRNVSIKTALVVPDNDNGVETLFSLRCHKNGPAPPAKNLSQQLYTFSVSSIAVQGDIWNEHATGMIGFNMSTRGKYQNTCLVFKAE